MSLVDHTKLNMLIPEYETDKIIDIFEGTLSISASTAALQTRYATATIPHNLGESFFTQLIYSIDGGSTWNDQDMSKPDLSGANPVFQTVDVTSYCNSTNVVVAATNWYNYVTGSSSAKTILYKVFAIAKSNQGDITPVPTNQLLRYASKYNYQKIIADEIVPRTVPAGSSSLAVAHGVTNGIPSTRAYVEYSNGNIWPITLNQYPATGGFPLNNDITCNAEISSSQIVYRFGNASGGSLSINFHYRIYLES